MWGAGLDCRFVASEIARPHGNPCADKNIDTRSIGDHVADPASVAVPVVTAATELDADNPRGTKSRRCRLPDRAAVR
jgi:hypothetical protein